MGVEALSVKELKALLRERGVDLTNVFEKADLIRLALECEGNTSPGSRHNNPRHEPNERSRARSPTWSDTVDPDDARGDAERPSVPKGRFGRLLQAAALLGVAVDASEEEMKAAYHQLARKWHPDKNPDQREHAEDMFKDVKAAHTLLMKAPLDKKQEARAMVDARERKRQQHAKEEEEVAERVRKASEGAEKPWAAGRQARPMEEVRDTGTRRSTDPTTQSTDAKGTRARPTQSTPGPGDSSRSRRTGPQTESTGRPTTARERREAWNAAMRNRDGAEEQREAEEAQERERRAARRRAQRELEKRAQREAEERSRRDAEQSSDADVLESARREAEELLQREAKARAQSEAKEREQREMADREAEEETRRREWRAQRELERLAQEAKERGEHEEEERMRRQAEERALLESERARREAEERQRKEREEHEEAERMRRQSEERALMESEQRARREADVRVQREVEAFAGREAMPKDAEDDRAAREAEEQAQEAEELARREAVERVRREAEERLRKEAEEQVRREAVANAIDALRDGMAGEDAGALQQAVLIANQVGGVPDRLLLDAINKLSRLESIRSAVRAPTAFRSATKTGTMGPGVSKAAKASASRSPTTTHAANSRPSREQPVPIEQPAKSDRSARRAAWNAVVHHGHTNDEPLDFAAEFAGDL